MGLHRVPILKDQYGDIVITWNARNREFPGVGLGCVAILARQTHEYTGGDVKRVKSIRPVRCATIIAVPYPGVILK